MKETYHVVVALTTPMLGTALPFKRGQTKKREEQTMKRKNGEMEVVAMEKKEVKKGPVVGDRYHAVIVLTEPMLGTVPKNKEVYKNYIEGKRPETAPQEDETETVVVVNDAKVLKEIEEKGWTGFHSDENGLFVYDYFIKGFLKNAGNVLKDALEVKALRSKIDDHVFVYPRRVYLGVKEPDGVFERPLRVITPQGPRVALVRSDLINAGRTFEFDLEVFPPRKEITRDLLIQLFEYGSRMGFGQFRNGSFGRFTYTLL